MRPASPLKQREFPRPKEFDPWAPIPFEELPRAIVEAYEHEDWSSLREHLRLVMDGVITDGPYGRQLLQLVRRLPLGVEPLFDRYRAVTSIDYGAWDDLRNCLQYSPVESSELEGLRDVWLAPIDRISAPSSMAPHQAAWFEAYEGQLQRSYGYYRRWAKRMLRQRFADIVWSRPDIP